MEAALTLPLTLFLVLGILQLFLMLQARVMAEYAAFRATRAGSVRHGDCQAMTHAAILALLPTFHSYLGNVPGDTPGRKLGRAFGMHKDNRYAPDTDGGHDRSVVWLLRESPVGVTGSEDSDFDEPRDSVTRLETRMIFWFPLKIPLANWVISRTMLAYWGYRAYTGADPLLVVSKADWRRGRASPPTLEEEVRRELMSRINLRQYVIPIHASASLRMMTPAQGRYFATQNCPPAPETL